jgi:Na+-translocating ferredoxin:NAD+ oxidoreductase RnfD subunit
VINRLATATYYFVVTAVDSLGIESAYSNVASEKIVSPCVTKAPMNLLNDTVLLTAVIIAASQH